MKHILSVLLFFSFFSIKGQGIEPSSVQPSPYLGGILKAITPVVDEFTGDTTYLYVHDSLSVSISDIFIDSDSLYFVIGSDTINVGIIPQGTVKTVTANGVSNLFTTVNIGHPVNPSIVFTPISIPNPNRVFASPNSIGGLPSFRALVNNDLPNSGVTAGTYTNSTVTVNTKGVVTSASSGTPVTGESTTVSDTPTMDLNLSGYNITANIKKKLNAGTVGGSDKFLYIQYDSTGQIEAISQLLSDDFDKDPYGEFQDITIDSVGRRFTIGITDGNEVSFIDQTGTSSIFMEGDSLYYVYEGDTLNIGLVVDTSYIPRIFTNATYADTSFVPSPRKYDVYVHAFFSESFYYDGDSWEIFDYDNGNQNEGQLYLDDYINDREATLQSNTPLSTPITFKASDNTMIIYPASGWVVYKVDTTVIATLYDLTLKQNTLVSGTNIKTINGNSLLGSGNLVISTVDSTNVSAGYGIDVTESPANTFTIKADTSEVATPYDLSLKQNQLTGSAGETIRFGGTNTPISSSLLYNNGNSIGIGTTSPIVGSKLTVEGAAIFSRPTFTDATIQLYNSANAGAGILFDDLSSGSDYMYYHGQHKTFTFGTGIATSTLNKKLNVLGGATIGSGYSTTAVDANSLKVEGSITVGTTTGTAVSNAALDANGKIVSSSLTSGTVTSVGLGLGTSGTDANISGSPITSSGTITLNLPTASASNRGLLSSANWTTFNDKVGGSGSSGRVTFWNGASTVSADDNFIWDNSNKRFGVGTTLPATGIHLVGKFTLEQSSSNNSTIIGKSAGQVNSGGSNLFIGPSAGVANTSGYENTFLSAGSGTANTTGYQNFYAGTAAGRLNNGYGNFALGSASLYSATNANNNVTIGVSSMQNATSSNNVAIGAASLFKATGNGNIAIGLQAGFDETGSNRLYIENSGSSSPLIGGHFDNNRIGINNAITDITNTLDVNGTLRVRTTTGTATTLMGRDANGVLISVPVSGLSVSSGTLTNSNTGTVTNFSAGDLSPLFTTTETSTTTTPALSFSQVAQAANTVYSGPTSGGTSNPTFRSLVGPDLPAPIILDYSYTGTTQTFTKTSYPGAKKVKVILIGGGGSGGSGQVTAKTTGASARGGGGGGSGAWVETDFEISTLQTSTTITVGNGGTTQPGITSSSSANGLAGNDGSLSSFGLLLVAYGGKGGAPGVTSPDGGYGFGGQGRNSWSSTGGSGGNFFDGFENDTNESQNLWYSSNGGGGGGGQYESSTATISTNGGKSNRLATLAVSGATGAGGANGTSSSAATSGSLWGRYMTTGGGGGGGSSSQTNRNGAAGGGGGYGAGGGGGAGVLSTGSSITSGSGGAGSPGRCIVIVYF